MITEDYANYEMAKKLKKAGFDWPCEHYYTIEDCIDGQVWLTSGICQNYNEAPELSCVKCSAPLLSQAQKWLREVKGIDVLVYNCACGYLWEVSKAMNGTGLILYDEKGDDENSGCWTSYEAALSAGISAALELIKNGG